MTPRQLLGRVLTALKSPREDARPLPIVDKYGRKIVTGASLQRGQVVCDSAGVSWFVAAWARSEKGSLLVNGEGYIRTAHEGDIYIVEQEAT